MSNNSIFISGSTPIPLPSEGFSKGGHLLTILASMDFALSKDPSSRFLIMFDHNEKDMRRFIKKGGNSRDSVLVRLEPPAVFPSQYSKRVTSLYGQIFTPGQIDSETGYVKMGWVYRYDANPVNPVLKIKEPCLLRQEINDDDLYINWRNRTINLSMVAANKVSPVISDNYRIRRQIAAKMDVEDIQIYGLYWDASFLQKLRHRMAVARFALSQKFFPNLNSIYGDLHLRFNTTKGEIGDKHDILKESRFSLVIENSNTYFSEKLFDAIFDGTIPLYIGPKIEESGLPDGIGINISGDVDEIRHVVNGLSKTEVINILRKGNEFINSSNFENLWSESGVYTSMVKEIRKKWEV